MLRTHAGSQGLLARRHVIQESIFQLVVCVCVIAYVSDLSYQQMEVECHVETLLPELTREPPGMSVQYIRLLHHHHHYHQQLSLC